MKSSGSAAIGIRNPGMWRVACGRPRRDRRTAFWGEADPAGGVDMALTGAAVAVIRAPPVHQRVDAEREGCRVRPSGGAVAEW